MQTLIIPKEAGGSIWGAQRPTRKGVDTMDRIEAQEKLLTKLADFAQATSDSMSKTSALMTSIIATLETLARKIEILEKEVHKFV